tara:strand:+ start:1469 stop:2371 length:903 start_codon:yes stop_codon:yes gene_type:complete
MKNKIITFSFSKVFRLENTFKNILIFFPLLLSDRSTNYSDIITLIVGFLIFTLITSICYATNDFTDLKKDLINKLKVQKFILKKNTIITLNFFLFLFLIFLFYFTDFLNIYLILYLLSFYLYNFFIKNIFLIDLIFLTSFYILRLFYGSELIGLNISYWFLLFFVSFFLIFSIFKRMIQISVNNLHSKNNIINYSLGDYPLLKKIIIVSTIINLFIFLLYLYEVAFPNTFISLSTPDTRYQQSILILSIIFLGYSLGLIRIIRLVFIKKIKKDIYLFALKDKVNYLFLIFNLLIAYFHVS